MDINQYQIYSAISEKKQNNTDGSCVTEIIKELDSFDKAEDVKKYLREKFRIRDPINNFPLMEDGILNYNVYETTFSIEIIKDNKHSIFCFNY